MGARPGECRSPDGRRSCVNRLYRLSSRRWWQRRAGAGARGFDSRPLAAPLQCVWNLPRADSGGAREQPARHAGGLLEGHTYVQTPPMSRTCTGCHGSRIRNEYSGRNEGFPGDVHLSQARFNCANCHSGDEMHGVGVESNHRYDGTRQPLCEECHADSSVQQHVLHGDKLACQVCHSVAYKNCADCHVQKADDGTPLFQTADSWMDFRIGLNPNPTAERPWIYVLVRHVPVSPTSFDFYGLNLLPNFNARPTWVLTTPHNIQRITPQNEKCENCHGNADLFLTLDAVLPGEQEANTPVIVEELP